MANARVTMDDIERALQFENMNISGGSIRDHKIRRNISLKGEFNNIDQIRSIVINNIDGAPIYLSNIADVKDGFKEQESYARLNGKNVITLSIVKRSGENLVIASDKIKQMISEMEAVHFPKDLEIVITGDQSNQTKTTLHDLINTIIIGFVLVTIILMFFMGTANALFVAMSVPLSMCIAFILMPAIGFTLNMIVLFSFLLALGIVVDDAIVVIENTHRIFENGKTDIVTAARHAAGEVFLPVLSGTLTTLAPFIPLAFWEGVIGEFMFFLPITLIITLTASLFVAYIINPVFAVSFMKPHHEENEKQFSKGEKISLIIMAALAAIFYIAGSVGMGNFIIVIALLFIFNKKVLSKWIKKFQTKTWPSVQNRYRKVLEWALEKPLTITFSTIGLFIFTFIFLGMRNPKVEFFPTADPNFIFTYITLPVGTDQAYTDSITKVAEDKIINEIGADNPIVTSVISNVAINVTDPAENDQGVYPYRSKIQVSFVEYALRNGESTRGYLERIRNATKNIPGVDISVAQEQGGPPTGKPINVEIKGDNLEDLIATSINVKYFLDSINVSGVEQLNSDMQANNPEIVLNIDRERANREGLSTAQIGMTLRTAVFGKEASKFRDLNDEYPIQIRLKKDQRYNVELLKNISITYRDMAKGGMVRSVPIANFVKEEYSGTYAGIKRKNLTRVVNLSSNVLEGYNPNEVVAAIEKYLIDFPAPDGISISMTGEQEEQAEAMSFLLNALLISLGLIFLILVTQFNSFSKPVIILTEIFFSLIGVFLGFAIFKMNISIIMTGIGIVALAGIVVRNGILLVEFTDVLLEQGIPLKEAIIEGGRTRMTPVILTATATILGLIPLAVGLNMDFTLLFSEFNPKIFFGGDSVAFWGPLSWTMIFGLGFATLLTLIILPVMYLMNYNLKQFLKRKVNALTSES